MPKVNKTKVRRFMRLHRTAFIDKCGGVDATGLAEVAAQQFDIYDDKVFFNISEWVFDMAAEIAWGK